MTSEINFIDIDPDFPVAGQDNESQGFRDNFSLIRSALQVAQGEISDLQQKSLLKSSLSNLNLDNNMNGNTIFNVRLSSSFESTYGSTISIDTNPSIEGLPVDFELGHYHHYVVGGEITFRLTGWPGPNNDPSVAKITVELTSKDNNAYNVNFTSWRTPDGSNGIIKYDENWPTTLTIDSPTSPVIVEFWSRNSGDTVYAKYLGKFS